MRQLIRRRYHGRGGPAGEGGRWPKAPRANSTDRQALRASSTSRHLLPGVDRSWRQAALWGEQGGGHSQTPARRTEGGGVQALRLRCLRDHRSGSSHTTRDNMRRLQVCREIQWSSHQHTTHTRSLSLSHPPSAPVRPLRPASRNGHGPCPEQPVSAAGHTAGLHASRLLKSSRGERGKGGGIEGGRGGGGWASPLAEAALSLRW